jgi:signal transduction histidine kinase
VCREAVVATAATAVVYLTLAYPGGPVTVPVLVALYGAAAHGRRVPALAVVAFFVGIGSAHRLVVQQEPFITVAFQGLLFVFAWLLGELVFSRRALRAEVAARLRRAAEEREREAARRVQQERMRIARELHDVVAHHIALVNVQAGVGLHLLQNDLHLACRSPGRTRHLVGDSGPVHRRFGLKSWHIHLI